MKQVNYLTTRLCEDNKFIEVRIITTKGKDVHKMINKEKTQQLIDRLQKLVKDMI